ncbi:HNH endonuclease [Aquibacillus sp. 3ASR75-11]|uniref:HNH endonuclease n=1 Tax=Terrihalobacillus insolitus TaxID=2950438 RepID=A0A9X4AQA3_9BACI|nr:HNH endonuclease [Terrihalobacillus insolitus]MDC3426325.1 HNH endonuclease [Terrihalobacillus insolitus]
MKFKNNYRIENDVAIIEYINQKGKYFEILVDKEDLPRLIENFKSIFVHVKKDKKVYAVGYIKGGKQIKVHRFIMNTPKGMETDHINHNTLDNRKENLRISTVAENQQNRKGGNKNNKSSGIRNVYWSKKENKWYVMIRQNGKRNYFGYYDEINEAAEVAKQKRKELFPFSTD